MGSGTGGGNSSNVGTIVNGGVNSSVNTSTTNNNSNGDGARAVANNGNANTATATVTAGGKDDGNGHDNHITNNGHSLPSTSADAVKANAVPQISVATAPSDANGSPSRPDEKLTMPPTPPPTTTRLQAGEIEKAAVGEAGEQLQVLTSGPVSAEKDGSVDAIKTPDAATLAAADTLAAAAAAAIGSLSEEKKAAEPHPAVEADSGQEKPVEAPKMEDLSGLQSITVAAIAAAAALQQQESEKATNANANANANVNANGAMDVDG